MRRSLFDTGLLPRDVRELSFGEGVALLDAAVKKNERRFDEALFHTALVAGPWYTGGAAALMRAISGEEETRSGAKPMAPQTVRAEDKTHLQILEQVEDRLEREAAKGSKAAVAKLVIVRSQIEEAELSNSAS